jgi:hypothetical protein
MTLNVQSDDGTVANANGYISVAEFKAYHDDRGNTYGADNLIAIAIIKATDYLDTRFEFIGVKLTTDQTTQWPRKAGTGQALVNTLDNDTFSPFIVVGVPSNNPIELVGPNGEIITGIPKAIKNATAEYALRSLNGGGGLYADAPAPSGGRLIDEISQKVDVIEQSIKYAESMPGAVVLPAYPVADLMLVRAGLVETGRSLFR